MRVNRGEFCFWDEEIFWFCMMMACFSSDVVATCGSMINGGVVDGVLEIGEMWGEGLVSS